MALAVLKCKVEGEAKVMRQIFSMFYVAANFYLIKSCWIVLKLSEICNQMLIAEILSRIEQFL